MCAHVQGRDDFRIERGGVTHMCRGGATLAQERGEGCACRGGATLAQERERGEGRVYELLQC